MTPERFAMIPEAVLYDHRLSSHAKVIYGVLVRHTNAEGVCWPGLNLVGELTGISVSHVQRAIRQLVGAGHVESIRRGQMQSNLYRVIGHRWESLPSDRSPAGKGSVTRGTRDRSPAGMNESKKNESKRKHTPLPPNGEEGANVEVTIRDGFQLDRRGRTVGVATSVMEATTSRSQVNAAEVQRVFDTWIASTGRTGRTQLDAKRRKAIQRALSDYPLPDVLDAVRGWERDPWPERVDHNDVTVLLRDAANIEKFRRLHQEGPPRRRVEPRSYRTIRETSDDPDAFDASMAMMFRRNGHKVTRRDAIEASSKEVEP